MLEFGVAPFFCRPLFHSSPRHHDHRRITREGKYWLETCSKYELRGATVPIKNEISALEIPAMINKGNRMKLKSIVFGILVSWSSVAQCAPPSIHLSGTMDYQNQRVAYVDGEIYKVNDEISGYRITRIDEYGMAVQKEEKSENYYIKIGDPSNVSLLENSESTPKPIAPDPKLIPDPHDREPTVTVTTTPTKESSSDLAKWILSITLMVIGFILSLIGGIWFLVEAFRTTVWWGLGCLFISIVELIFLIIHWDRAAKPFGLSVLGGVILFVGAFAAPGSFETYL
jgi:hypothetical protein